MYIVVNCYHILLHSRKGKDEFIILLSYEINTINGNKLPNSDEWINRFIIEYKFLRFWNHTIFYLIRSIIKQRILHCYIFNNWNLSKKENIISDKMMTPRFLCKQRTVLLWAIFIKPAYIRLPTTYSFQEAEEKYVSMCVWFNLTSTNIAFS